ncbi:proton-conducting transporter membrane subunit [Rhodoferax sp.]|uniref:proton-conducting transporter transmembrane domain-containing protein n=1 Tax=Rhodoferax sp. TaxID=50421 RepID=UPI00271A25B5|nr:proton-conducting transporter membrane subunit [Rhodoferax sp.]MDO8318314.1 proton-conducting transporter membrane subunit [Rhodoferax sp.]
MNQLLAAALILLLGAALAMLPVKNSWRAGFGIVSQTIATLLAWATVLPVLRDGTEAYVELPWGYPIGEMHFKLNALGAFFLSWSLPMTLLGAVYAVGYLRKYFDGPRHVGVHFALLNMISLSFLMVYTGEHAMTFLMGWEVAALSAWLLVIWDYTNQKVRFAGFNYLVSTHIGLIFLVAAFMILYAQTQSWYLDDWGDWMSLHPGTIRNTVFLLLLTSFGLKSAFFPFHSWLPRAHAAAPANVSALMSGVIHKAGLFALLHFLLIQGKPDAWMGWALLVFSITSAVIGGLYTVGQRDLKRLLGYSSTENVGIAGIGFGIGTLGLAWDVPGLVALGFAGGMLHILNHAFFKCQLFYAAGCVYQVKHSVDIERLGGLAKLMPITSLSFLVGGIAISALPPFNGFASEFLIYSGLFTGETISVWAKLPLAGVATLLAFVGAVSALSITRAYGVIFMGQARDDTLPDGHEPGGWMLTPLLMHSTGTVLLGLMPVLGLALVAAPTRLFLHAVPDAAALQAMQDVYDVLGRVSLVSVAVAGLIVLAWAAAWALRHVLRQQAAATGPTWGCGYTAGNTRLQYTGSSFSKDFSQNYTGVMTLLKRQKAPTGYFPDDAYVVTDCVDAVERRLYNVIGHGDESAGLISKLMHEDDPRLAFALGLAAVMAIAALVVLAEGALP